jgi:hypothetical protein
MELRAFFDRNDRGPDIANKNAGLKDVNLFNGCDGAIDLAAIHEHSSRYDPLDDGMLSDDQSSGCMYLAVDVSINPDGAIKTHDSLEVNTFSQERNILVALFGLLAPFSRCPHDRLPKILPHIDGTSHTSNVQDKHLNINIPP